MKYHFGVPGILIWLTHILTGLYFVYLGYSMNKTNTFKNHGIVFNELLTITNMPINRYGAVLLAKGEFNNYMSLLRKSYNPENLDTVMCRNLISLDWKGDVYDCDFNQMLNLNIEGFKKTHISELEDNIVSKRINTGDHCYGCSAGSGSSCGGTLI